MKYTSGKMSGVAMAQWKIIRKIPDSSVLNVPYMIMGEPGSNQWIYYLRNDSDDATIMARCSSDYKIGAKIHEADLKKL